MRNEYPTPKNCRSITKVDWLVYWFIGSVGVKKFVTMPVTAQ
jgi:hypothetical protein